MLSSIGHQHFQSLPTLLCYPNLSKNAYISWAIWILYFLFHCSPSTSHIFWTKFFLLKVNHNLWFRLWHKKNCRLSTSCTTICSQANITSLFIMHKIRSHLIWLTCSLKVRHRINCVQCLLMLICKSDNSLLKFLHIQFNIRLTFQENRSSND